MLGILHLIRILNNAYSGSTVIIANQFFVRLYPFCLGGFCALVFAPCVVFVQDVFMRCCCITSLFMYVHRVVCIRWLTYISFYYPFYFCSLHTLFSPRDRNKQKQRSNKPSTNTRQHSAGCFLFSFFQSVLHCYNASSKVISLVKWSLDSVHFQSVFFIHSQFPYKLFYQIYLFVYFLSVKI